MHKVEMASVWDAWGVVGVRGSSSIGRILFYFGLLYFLWLFQAGLIADRDGG